LERLKVRAAFCFDLLSPQVIPSEIAARLFLDAVLYRYRAGIPVAGFAGAIR
jgi:hypothetical protein